MRVEKKYEIKNKTESEANQSVRVCDTYMWFALFLTSFIGIFGRLIEHHPYISRLHNISSDLSTICF